MVMIVKASGEKAPFEPSKLKRSLERGGANKELINQITNEVSKSISENTSTHKIYQLAFRLLRKKSRVMGAKYHLKRAIMRLGQSGYPFEKFVAELLRSQHYSVQNNQIVQGYCVAHEIDVMAKKDNNLIFVECKYHNRQGLKSDVKVALYVSARIHDLKLAFGKNAPEIEVSGMLVTNTRLTEEAMRYATCIGLSAISWDYPERGSLQELVEVSGLYPVTCITNFTTAEISTLLEKQVVLCKMILDNPKLLNELRIPEQRMKSILQQCHLLCAYT